MKIALFTETYVNSINGVMAHIKTLKNGLEEMGHQVLVVTADKYARRHYIQDGILHCPAVESKRFYGFGIASPNSHKRQRMIADFGPDIIHIHQEFGIGLSGIKAARLLHLPLVYTLHTMYDEYVYYIAPKKFLRLATNFSHKYERYIAQRANALTSPSQKGYEYFKQIGIQKEFNLIPNSADLDAFNPHKISQEQKDEVRKRHNIPADRTIACFVGRLGKEKSVDVLLQYWADTIGEKDGLHLMIVGEGPDQDALKEQAQSKGIAGMVTFTGLVPHDRMPVYFAACDAYVTASLSEMNSISMLEGMASGLPTLQRYDELNADQIQQGVNGYLYHNAQQLADKLREIRGLSPQELIGMKERVIETVTNRGSNELAVYMMEIYEKAMEEKQLELVELRRAL